MPLRQPIPPALCTRSHGMANVLDETKSIPSPRRRRPLTLNSRRRENTKQTHFRPQPIANKTHLAPERTRFHPNPTAMPPCHRRAKRDGQKGQKGAKRDGRIFPLGRFPHPHRWPCSHSWSVGGLMQALTHGSQTTSMHAEGPASREQQYGQNELSESPVGKRVGAGFATGGDEFGKTATASMEAVEE